MKKLRAFYAVVVFAVSTLLLSIVNAWALPVKIEPSTKIRNVIVFTESSMIKKEARFNVGKGENIVRMSGFTPYLVDQSVQVSIEGKSAVKISEVKVAETNDPQEKMLKLQAKLYSIDEAMKTSSNEISVITNSSEFIKKVVPFSQNQKVTQSEVASHARFLEKSLAENYKRISGIEVKLRKLKEEKDVVENEIKDLRSLNKSKSIDIVLISPDDNKEVTLLFSYVVNNAGWSPLYEVRADSNASKINMNYFAAIKQSTGEDWTGVNVEISTAKPYSSKAPSDLTTWFVDLYQPEQYDRPYMELERMSKSAMPSPMSMEDSSMGGDGLPFQETRVKAETTSFSFIIPRKVTIPSDNQPHKVMVASSEKEAEFSYYAIPKLSKYAYLKTSLKSPFSFTLLAGNMNVFLDGRLVSSSYFDKTISRDEEIKLSLGIDESIRIERKLENKFTDYSGLISKETKVSYEYKHELVNAKEREVTISINDHFPVSRNESIKIELESPKKNEAEISNEGIITWKVKLEPGEKKNLALKFSVAYPKELTVTGLE